MNISGSVLLNFIAMGQMTEALFDKKASDLELSIKQRCTIELMWKKISHTDIH